VDERRHPVRLAYSLITVDSQGRSRGQLLVHRPNSS
jgi:hypothetical protein